MIFIVFILTVLLTLHLLGRGSGDNYGKSLKNIKDISIKEKNNYVA
jgi:hypothetical protein